MTCEEIGLEIGEEIDCECAACGVGQKIVDYMNLWSDASLRLNETFLFITHITRSVNIRSIPNDIQSKSR